MRIESNGLDIVDNKNTLFFTVITAICSLAVSFGGFLYQALYCYAWNIPLDSVNLLGNGRTLFMAMSGLLYSALWTFLTIVVTEIYKKNLPIVLAFRRINRSLTKIDTIGYEKEVKEIRSHAGFLASKIRGYGLKIIVLAVVIGIIPSAIIYSVAFEGAIIVNVIVAIITSVVNILIVYYPEKKKAEEALSIKYGKIGSNGARKEIEKNGSIMKWAKKYITSNRLVLGFSDLSTIINRRNMTTMVILSVVNFTVTISIFGAINPYVRKNFWIYSEGETNYVLIRKSGDETIYKEAIIDNDSIEVFLTKQVYDAGLGKTHEYRNFKEVIIKR